nr:MAG TPA: hypothetical protein [Caudoviricetes sp.]
MLQEAIVNILINKMKAQYDLDHYVIAEKHIKKDSIKIKFVLGTVSNTVERKKVSNGNVAYYNILDKSYREQVTENSFVQKYQDRENFNDMGDWTEEQIKTLCEDIAEEIIMENTNKENKGNQYYGNSNNTMRDAEIVEDEEDEKPSYTSKAIEYNNDKEEERKEEEGNE